ncbi:unnamed protein product [Cochlearia groenlandica]
MNNSRDGYSYVPNQPDRYQSSRTRSSGWRLPVFSSRNPWSRSDLVINRRLLDESQSVYLGTAVSLTIDSIQPSHTRHHIPTRNTNNLRRQHLETLRQAIHNNPYNNNNNSRTTSTQAKEEVENVLKHLTKETYNPVPKNLLLRNLSLYYRNKNSKGENSRNFRDFSEEEEKRCSVCLEDFEAKETVMITPCKHMFHEECIVTWLKSKGQCPLCRYLIVKEEKRDQSSSDVRSNLDGDMTVNDLFTLELISVVRAMEETFLFGHPRRF